MQYDAATRLYPGTTKPAVNDPILPLGTFPAPGLYPTTCRIAYDATAQTYTVALEGFVKRD